MANERDTARSSHRPSVSEKSAELSEFEFGLMIASEAFNRWVVRCMGARGCATSPPWTWWSSTVSITRTREAAQRHLFRPQYRGCHLVTYALKKLVAWSGRAQPARKDRVRDHGGGRDMCSRYRKVRDACLIERCRPWAP